MRFLNLYEDKNCKKKQLKTTDKFFVGSTFASISFQLDNSALRNDVFCKSEHFLNMDCQSLSSQN